MSGGTGLDCPECGRRHRAPADLLAVRRKPGALWLGGALLAAGIVVSLAGYIDTMRGSWWRLAPTRVLLRQLRSTENSLARDAIWGRIEDGDPAQTLARPGALSEAAWDELATVCSSLLGDPAVSRSRHAWAITTLSCVIPDERIVDREMEMLIASTDCRLRSWGLSGVHTYWLTRQHLSEQWADNVIAAARDTRCPAEATMATHLLARIDPIQTEALISILAGTSGPNAPQWAEVVSGVTAKWKDEDRLRFVEWLETSGVPGAAEAAAAIRAEWASLETGAP
jgi:hypothetical protein